MKIEKYESLFMTKDRWNFIFRPITALRYKVIGDYSFELPKNFIVHLRIKDENRKNL